MTPVCAGVLVWNNFRALRFHFVITSSSTRRKKIRARSEAEAGELPSTNPEHVADETRTRINTDADMDEKMRMRNCGWWIKRGLPGGDCGILYIRYKSIKIPQITLKTKKIPEMF